MSCDIQNNVAVEESNIVEEEPEPEPEPEPKPEPEFVQDVPLPSKWDKEKCTHTWTSVSFKTIFFWSSQGVLKVSLVDPTPSPPVTKY